MNMCIYTYIYIYTHVTVRLYALTRLNACLDTPGIVALLPLYHTRDRGDGGGESHSQGGGEPNTQGGGGVDNQ